MIPIQQLGVVWSTISGHAVQQEVFVTPQVASVHIIAILERSVLLEAVNTVIGTMCVVLRGLPVPIMNVVENVQPIKLVAKTEVRQI